MTTDTIFAQAFACAGGDVQAAFLNEAGRTLNRVCEADGVRLDTQACFIVDQLDLHGRALVERLASFIQADKEARR